MHLKSLEITGFKSFAEMRIEFPRGVTAVVGPNGAGKSNVVDSILWVLGEQSTKTLRSERMEDVIFNGTQTRKPLGMAEVSLVLGGLNHKNLEALPGLPDDLRDYHEVMVTRRLYRNGDSEYLINKTPCRLKDLRSLFLETRAGSKGHTIIEQGRIEQILNASPQDRRELIEETAGIVRYKKQKAEALRKLDATQQNLLRVRDIVTEVHRQLKSLERQARQARSYQELHQEARTLEITLLVRDYGVLSATHHQIEDERGAIESREAEQMAEQGRLGQQVEEIKLSLTSVEGLIARLRDEVAGVEHQQAHALTAIEVERGRIELFEQQREQAVAEQGRLEQEREQVGQQLEALHARLAESLAEIAQCQQRLTEVEEAARMLALQRSDASAQEMASRRALMELTVEVTNTQNGVAMVQSRCEELLRRIARLERERQEVEGECEAARTKLQRVIAQRQEAEQRLADRRRDREQGLDQQRERGEQLKMTDQELSRGQEALAAVESRLEALQGIIREEMGYGRKGEESSTSLRAGCPGVREAMAEWLNVPVGYERAFEAVLGERVKAWFVEHPGDAGRAVQFLKDKGLGRGTFVPVQPRWAQNTGHRERAWWRAVSGRPGVLGHALDLIQPSSASEGRDILLALFERVVVVTNLDVAIQLWEQGAWTAPDGPVLVTLDGELLDAAGVLSGGTVEGSQGLLQRRRETQQLEHEREILQQALQVRRELRERYVAELEALGAAVQQYDQAIRDAEAQHLTLAKDEAALGPGLAELERRLEVIEAERGAAHQDRDHSEQEVAAQGERLSSLLVEKAAGETALAQLQQALQQLDAEMQQGQGRMLSARLALSEAKSQRDHAEAEQQRLQKQQGEQRARTLAVEQELAALMTELQRAQAERARNQQVFQEMAERAGKLKTDLTTTQETQAQDLQVLQGLEQALGSVREVLNRTREARTAVEIRRAETRTQLTTLEGTLSGTYQLSVSQALAEYPAPAPQQILPSSEPEAFPEVEGTREGEDVMALRAQLQKLRERLSRMGPINLAAIDEHRELDERYRFLTSQQEDLTNSIASLKEIISRINKTTKQMFMETFSELQQKFGEVFGRFFPGGRAELVLVDPKQLTTAQSGDQLGDGSNGTNGTHETNGGNGAHVDERTANGQGNGSNGSNGSDGDGHGTEPSYQEPGVDIVAQPPGKRLKSIAMLSGGEKTLTAMALIFASFLIRPTPFCILDEIDAPLDEQNIGRFTAVLRELAQEAQFIVITHSKHTMAIADSLFGVTMEEPGVSKVVSVRLNDLQPA